MKLIWYRPGGDSRPLLPDVELFNRSLRAILDLVIRLPSAIGILQVYNQQRTVGTLTGPFAEEEGHNSLVTAFFFLVQDSFNNLLAL